MTARPHFLPMPAGRRWASLRPRPALALAWRLACLLVLCASQALAAPPSALRFERLSSAMGLPQDSVFAVAQDQHGFIWLGTQNGLARYDGYQVATLAHVPGEPNSLADNWVHALLPGDGVLWIATQAGLQKYDLRQQRFTLYVPENASDTQRDISSMVEDGHGGLWLGTMDGLLHFDPASGRFRALRHRDDDPASLAGSVVRALARDASGALWVALRGGLDRLPAGAQRFEHYARTPGDPRDSYRALLAEGNAVWAASDAGLQRWELDGAAARRREVGLAAGIPAAPVLSLGFDQLRNLWLGTSRGAYQLRRSDGVVVPYLHQDGDPYTPSAGNVISLMQDRSGSLWLGTMNGVSRADLAGGGFGRIVHSAGDPDGLSDNSVVRIADAGRGKLWLSTRNGGLNFYDPASGKARIWRHRDGDAGSLPDDSVTATASDPSGRLWVATRAGLARYDAASDRFIPVRFRNEDGGSNATYAMMCSRAGMLWIGTPSGLYSYDSSSGAARHYRRQSGRDDAPSSDIIYALREDRQGRLWVGTAGGVDVLDQASGRWQHFRHQPGNPRSIDHNRVWTLFEDRDGTMWIGTAQGLSRADRDAGGGYSFQSYPARLAIVSIEQAADGHLWAATDAGLFRFDPATGARQWYTSSDGITEGDFLTSSSLRAADGTIYFGSNIGGITAFRPGEVRGNPVAPSVVLTNFQILNSTVRHGAEPPGVVMDSPIEFARALELSYRHVVFSIEFAALHYAAPARNRYAYQLVGFDKDWVPADAARRFATYTNLDPGNYVFRVKASNKDGVWAELSEPLRITITPPFWKTWSFRLLLVSALLLLAYAGYLLRVQRYERREEELEANVRERDAAVDAAVRALHATQQQLILREKMASVGTLTAGIAHEINNPVNFAHVGAQALDRELEAFRQFLLTLAGDDADPEVMARLNQRIDQLNHQAGNVLEGTSRIRLLVKDLLSFSRLGEAERKPVAIGDSLLSTVNLVRSYYADLVEIDCRLDANPELDCWPSLLNQVFMNMIVNACQAIEARYPRGSGLGKLVIRSSIDGGAELQLEFCDNGSGIAPDALPRIFEPFFTTKAVGEGTGLGLSTSFGIIAQHGGRITVQSSLGQGTTFTIHLPLHK